MQTIGPGKMLIIVLLLFFSTDIHALLYDVSCADGGVYLRYPVNTDADPRNEMPHVFAMTQDKVCNVDKMYELVRVTNCGSMTPIRLYVANGTNAYDVIAVTCTVPGRYGRQIISDPAQPIPNTDVESDRVLTTSVKMESKLVFSNLTEIQPIKCSPNDRGILYIGNPDPYRFRSVLAYDSVSNARCKADMIEGHRLVAIYDCSLAQPVIASFSTAEVHSEIIGGPPGTFKTYKISCSDDTAIPETKAKEIALIIKKPWRQIE